MRYRLPETEIEKKLMAILEARFIQMHDSIALPGIPTGYSMAMLDIYQILGIYIPDEDEKVDLLFMSLKELEEIKYEL